jgi:hypothetical protein
VRPFARNRCSSVRVYLSWFGGFEIDGGFDSSVVEPVLLTGLGIPRVGWSDRWDLAGLGAFVLVGIWGLGFQVRVYNGEFLVSVELVG